MCSHWETSALSSPGLSKTPTPFNQPVAPQRTRRVGARVGHGGSTSSTNAIQRVARVVRRARAAIANVDDATLSLVPQIDDSQRGEDCRDDKLYRCPHAHRLMGSMELDVATYSRRPSSPYRRYGPHCRFPDQAACPIDSAQSEQVSSFLGMAQTGAASHLRRSSRPAYACQDEEAQPHLRARQDGLHTLENLAAKVERERRDESHEGPGSGSKNGGRSPVGRTMVGESARTLPKNCTYWRRTEHDGYRNRFKHSVGPLTHDPSMSGLFGAAVPCEDEDINTVLLKIDTVRRGGSRRGRREYGLQPR